MGRGRALKLNMIMNLFSEFVAMVAGLIMPRLILLYFGSSCSGLVNSIAQFLGFTAILRAGVSGVVQVALYRPLAERNEEELNGIMAAAGSYMRGIGAIVGGIILALAVIYPYCVRDEYDVFFAAEMVLIIGVGTFVNNFFGMKYKFLLQADQKFYIQIGSATITHILITIVSIVLIVQGCTIQAVKMAASFVALADPVMLSLYVRKHYKINWKAKANDLVIKQRWDAFFHQAALTVNSNIDLVLLTLFLSLKEVSVYTVHYLVVNNINKVVDSCVVGVNSTFGDIIVKNEKENLKRVFLFMEWLMSFLCIILYSTTAVMLCAFIRLYTSSVTDVNYIRPVFAVSMVVAMMLMSMRQPYWKLVEGAGKYRETRNGAIAEAAVNLLISMVMVRFFGIIGVIFGTITACLVRSMEISFYCMRDILGVTRLHIIKHYALSLAAFAGCYLLGGLVLPEEIGNYLVWAGCAVLVMVISTLISVGIGVVFYREQIKELVWRVRMTLGIRRVGAHEKKN